MWQNNFQKDESKLNIIAVGGYGRGEFTQNQILTYNFLDKNSKNDLKIIFQNF